MVKKEKFTYVPERGDIVWINLNPQAGHEQTGKRPALVISPLKYNRVLGLAIFCPITSKVKGYPFEVEIPDGIKIKGAILSDQIKSLDWKVRDVKYICKLNQEMTEIVLDKLNTLIRF